MKNKLALALVSILVLTSCNGNKKGHHAQADSMMQENFAHNAGDRVHFAYDSSELNEHSKLTLKKQGEWLRAHPHTTATVAGHCDKRGTSEYNLGLGERRAHAAADFLRSQGLQNDRVHTVSYGKEKLFVEGDNEEAHRMNRVSVTEVK